MNDKSTDSVDKYLEIIAEKEGIIYHLAEKFAKES